MFHLLCSVALCFDAGLDSHMSENPVFPDLYYDQLIDHNNPDLGTFPQLFYVMKRFKTQNGPVIIKIGDPVAQLEPAGTSDFLVEVAHKYGGMTVTLQHRYFGKSFPFSNTTTESLKYLTVEQAIEDVVAFKKFFAEKYELPENTSWILAGASYSGMLAAATMKSHPGEFSAALSFSGLIQVSDDFKDYDMATAINMGQECASAMRETMNQISHLLETDLTVVKSMFKAEEVEDAYLPYVFSQIVSLPVQDGHPELVCGPVMSAMFRNADPVTALSNFVRTTFKELYGDLRKYGDDYLANTGADYDTAERTWLWLRCNEVAYWETSSQRSGVFLPSVTKAMFEDKCKRVFGDSIQPPDVDAFNQKYGGLSNDAKHVYYLTNSQDPWMTASVTPDSGYVQDSFALTITGKKGGHCAELNAVSESDPIELTRAREHLLTLIGQWI